MAYTGWRGRLDAVDLIVITKNGQGVCVNSYIRKIYRERCEAAEAAAQRVQELHQTILDRWRRMVTDGVLYTQAERMADSDSLQVVNEQFQTILVSIYEIEDSERG